MKQITSTAGSLGSQQCCVVCFLLCDFYFFESTLMNSGILFMKDWEHYPNATLHTSTKNQSWVRYCQKLQYMGVKNYKFPLALIDRDLLDLDPHQEVGLTQNDILKITAEAKINPMYHFREIARAPRRSGNRNTPFEANRANIGFIWLFLNHITSILTQPRQTGKSFTFYSLSEWLFAVRCQATTINLLTKNDKLRLEAMDTLKGLYDQYPYYLKLRKPTDRWNTEEMHISELDTYYKTHVPSSSELGANNIGRGMATPILGVDEGPFQPHIGTAFEAATGAMGAAIEESKRAGAPYGIMMMTTAARIDTASGKYMWDYVCGSAKWSEFFFDAANQAELENMIRKAAPDKVPRVYLSFNHRQLGKTDQWLLEQKERTNQKGDVFANDYLCVWTNGGQGSPFTEADIRRIISGKSDDPYHSTLHQYVLRWHVPKDEIEKHMMHRTTTIGLDTSQALGSDAIGFVILDNETGAVVAAQEHSLTNIYEFSQFIFELMRQYPKTTLMPERKDVCLAIVDLLIVKFEECGIDPFKRIFNWVIQEPLEHPELHRELMTPLQRRDTRTRMLMKRHIGYNTSATGKQARSRLMSDTLFRAVDTSAETIRDAEIINQLMTLEVKDGRIQHQENGHDDMVFAWVLPHWMLRNGKNLAHYGINSRTALTNVRATKQSATEIWLKTEQERLRQEFDGLIAGYSNADDPILQKHYENRLRFLETKMVKDESAPTTLDAILLQIRETKLSRRNQGSAWAERKVSAVTQPVEKPRRMYDQIEQFWN